MSKYGPCELLLPTCVPGPLAWWQCPAGRTVRLCEPHLNLSFDSADGEPSSEPVAWGWLVPPTPSADQLAAALRDPRNREAVSMVLRAEARSGAPWLRDLIAREQRASRLIRV